MSEFDTTDHRIHRVVGFTQDGARVVLGEYMEFWEAVLLKCLRGRKYPKAEIEIEKPPPVQIRKPF